MREFDYIVCGAGTSGCVVAARLAANPQTRVLLLEAGGNDESEIICDPNRWPMTLGSPFDWGFRTEPNPRLNGRAIAYSMGKVLGGGSGINVSTWSRGHRADWDFYASESGNRAWGYEAVLDLYRSRIEDWVGNPDPSHRGTGGKVRVQSPQNPHPFSRAFLSAAESAGLRRFPNPNGQMMEAANGCSLVDETVVDGRRQSIFRAYLQPLLGQPNLTVLTEALATRLWFDGPRAAGVEYQHHGVTVRAAAACEVILSLGAINTPKLLMYSGIGPEDELRRAGVPLWCSLPGVGRNLHDHVAFGCIWQVIDEARAPPSVPRSQIAAFWKTRPDLDSPNFYTYARRGAALTPENASRFRPPAVSWSLSLGMRPLSRGLIHLTGPDPTGAVSIDAGYLSSPEDMQDLLTGLRFAREMGNSPIMRPFSGPEVAPGALEPADQQEFLRNGLGTFWHQCGTTRMGRDPMAVVDGELKVYGVEGLRIADASILPRVTSGNTMAPCVVIGEQAALFLLADNFPNRSKQ